MWLLFYHVSEMETIREWQWTSLEDFTIALLNIEYQPLMYMLLF